MDERFVRQLRLEPKTRLRPFLAARVAAYEAESSRVRLLRLYWVVAALLSLAILAAADWRIAAAAVVVGGVFSFGRRRLFRYLYPFLR